MPVHPLAELFPIIEGAAFDDLVTSIKEIGQIEAIVTLDGTILDGRNRYRACEAAGVQPRLEVFTGDDPARFVVAKNIHRRHLTTSQRALIAAQFAPMKRGDIASQRSGDGNPSPCLSAKEAAEIFNVSKDSVAAAKLVLREGNPDEIAGIRNGSVAVSTVAEAIRKGKPGEQRKAEREAPKGWSEERQRNQQLHSDIWRQLKGALEGITGLPLPTEVVQIAKPLDKKTKGAAVDRRLQPAIEWLREFADAWNSRRDQQK